MLQDFFTFPLPIIWSIEENIKGSIETGKLADFTVFSQDLMKVPVDRILETRVAYTIINGEIVYQKQND